MGTNVPKGWEKLRLGDIATLQRGFDLTLSSIIKGDYPVVTSSGIIGYHNEFKCKSPGIVTGRYGSLGAWYFLETEFWAHNTALWVKDFHGNYEKFIYYMLSNLDLSLFSGKTGVPGINRNDLHEIPSFLPPLAEQKRIAEILTKYDEGVELLEKQIATKQSQKRALMQRLLTGKVRFKEFAGSEWKKISADNVFINTSKKGNIDLPLLSVMQDIGVVPRDSLDRKVAMPDGDTLGYKLVEPSNFVISLRSFEGGLEYSKYLGIVSPAYTVLKNTQPIIDAFYQQYFKSYDFIGHLAVAVIGIRDGKQISYDDFSLIKIPIPSLPEQARIATILSIADKEITLLKEKLTQLKLLKKGLMQQLLSGKVRVNV